MVVDVALELVGQVPGVSGGEATVPHTQQLGRQLLHHSTFKIQRERRKELIEMPTQHSHSGRPKKVTKLGKTKLQKPRIGLPMTSNYILTQQLWSGEFSNYIETTDMFLQVF